MEFGTRRQSRSGSTPSERAIRSDEIMERALKGHTQSRKKSESAFAFISQLREDRKRERGVWLLFHNL